MKQLFMMRPQQPVRVRELPTGYRYELYRGTEGEVRDWLAICRCGLLPEDAGQESFDCNITRYQNLVPEQDLFFVTDASGHRVATTAAVKHQSGEGYIHMVAALPECRGKGIGHAMLSHALQMLEARGCGVMTLTTDDFRLAAIKTYLDAGFLPVLWADPESDMRARWDAVIALLGYPPVTYLTQV